MLPVAEVLDSLRGALCEGSAAVLIAPPGAGKTTLVPLALKDEPWAGRGRIIVLEPRRLAARAAAARMAAMLGEPVGRTVGFRVRLQSMVSDATRIEVVTEGVFTRKILDDPGLDGVSAVIFDEFHERSLDADLGLALARDAQAALREDLRILVMSATLDGGRVAGLLGGAPVIESLGRAFPVETRYVGRDSVQGLEDQVARTVGRAVAEEDGSILVFLPGAAEIRRVETRLAERFAGRPDLLIAPLYGALPPEVQDRAIAPAPAGRRKIVLATSIAETSLTIEGVRVVVDSGLSRTPRYDLASGLSRLQTVRVSRAAADQRRGRAGRTRAGVCYRLWDEAETRALTPFARPEILESDLSGLALDLAQWGARDAGGLALLDPPPAGAFAEARALLARLHALDSRGALTEHGRRMARLPLPPRLAHLVLEGARLGAGVRAARIAAVLSERGLGGDGADLAERLERLEHDTGRRGRDALALAERWRRTAGAPAADSVGGLDGVLLAAAYPERIAKAGGAAGEFRLVGGRGVRIDPTDALAREAWLAVGELGGGERRDRILVAARIAAEDILAAFGDDILETLDVRLDEQGRVVAEQGRNLGVLRLEARKAEHPPQALVAAALLAGVRRRGIGRLPWSATALRLRARLQFMRSLDPQAWPDLSDAVLEATLETWLAPFLSGLRGLDAVGDVLDAAMAALVPHDVRRALDTTAPERFVAPTGSAFTIDYTAEGGPRVEVRVQEMFGLSRHPTVAEGRVALVLALLSPAHRSLQVTRDLPGFWAGSWQAVRGEMKGRYPKHVWPQDPAAAAPTTRAKPRGS